MPLVLVVLIIVGAFVYCLKYNSVWGLVVSLCMLVVLGFLTFKSPALLLILVGTGLVSWLGVVFKHL